jgi:hypothetical protein
MMGAVNCLHWRSLTLATPNEKDLADIEVTIVNSWALHIIIMIKEKWESFFDFYA